MAAAIKAHHPHKPTASRTTTLTQHIKTKPPPRTANTLLQTTLHQATTSDRVTRVITTSMTHGLNISHLTSTPMLNSSVAPLTHPINSVSPRITRKHKISRVSMTTTTKYLQACHLAGLARISRCPKARIGAIKSKSCRAMRRGA